jgi:regulator of sirC expression with transglutaminase-like and TPR domain
LENAQRRDYSTTSGDGGQSRRCHALNNQHFKRNLRVIPPPSKATQMANRPELCRPQAFHFFARQLPVIETTQGLLDAAIAISMHSLDGVEPRSIRMRLETLAQRVRVRVRSPNPQARLAHFHDVLFEEEGYRGNSKDYYNPANSYLSMVLDSRRGIPITLCLIYKVVGERLGLKVDGVNAPGHFLARVHTETGSMIIDPFLGGDALRDEEAYERVEQVTGRPLPRSPQYLATASHAQWLSRMIVNLQHIFASTERRGDLAAMGELQSLLDYSLY